MTRLTIDTSNQQHPSLEDEAGEAWLELKELLAKRIDQGLVGRVSNRRIGEILSEELAGDRSASRADMACAIRSANQ